MGRAVSRRCCHFRTFEACRDERSLWGSTAFCSQNPRYLPYWQGRGFGEEPRRKVSAQEEASAALAPKTVEARWPAAMLAGPR